MEIKIDNSFKKSLVILTSGSLISQLITILTSPLLTRLFTSEQIGVYTYILSITTMFMAVINGRYDMCIVSEENEDDIYALIKLSIVIGFIASLIITISFYLYIKITGNSKIDYMYIYLVFFILLLTYSVNNVLIAYNNRNKEYQIMTYVQVIRSLYQNVGSLILGIFKVGLLGLLIPYAFGQIKGIKKQFQAMKPHVDKIRITSRYRMKEVLIKYKKQPLYSAPAIFANSFSYTSITLFIEVLFGMASVAYYSMSVRILGIPLSIISGNISKIFFQEASKEYNQTGKFYKSFNKVVLFQLILALPMVILMVLFAPKICSIVFGNEWIIAGEYVRILAPMFGVRFIVTAISPGMIIANKQKSELILQFMFIIASIFSLIFCKIINGDIIYYLALISGLYSIGYIFYLVVVYKYSKGNM